MRFSFKLITIGLLIAAATASQAALTFTYSGHVILSNAAGIHFGDDFSGSMQLDSAAFVGGGSHVGLYSAVGTQSFDLDFVHVSNAAIDGAAVYDGGGPYSFLGADSVGIGSISNSAQTGFGLVFAGNKHKIDSTDLNDALTTDWSNGQYWVGYQDCKLVVVKLDCVQAVPEPATMAALGLGAFGLIRRRRK